MDRNIESHPGQRRQQMTRVPTIISVSEACHSRFFNEVGSAAQLLLWVGCTRLVVCLQFGYRYK